MACQHLKMSPRLHPLPALAAVHAAEAGKLPLRKRTHLRAKLHRHLARQVSAPAAPVDLAALQAQTATPDSSMVHPGCTSGVAGWARAPTGARAAAPPSPCPSAPQPAPPPPTPARAEAHTPAQPSPARSLIHPPQPFPAFSCAPGPSSGQNCPLHGHPKPNFTLGADGGCQGEGGTRAAPAAASAAALGAVKGCMLAARLKPAPGRPPRAQAVTWCT